MLKQFAQLKKAPFRTSEQSLKPAVGPLRSRVATLRPLRDIQGRIGASQTWDGPSQVSNGSFQIWDDPSQVWEDPSKSMGIKLKYIKLEKYYGRVRQINSDCEVRCLLQLHSHSFPEHWPLIVVYQATEVIRR